MDTKKQTPSQEQPKEPQTMDEWYNYSPAMRQYGDLFQPPPSLQQPDTDNNA